ncbi:hypothetical protein D9M69_142500 [compost metagenome]
MLIHNFDSITLQYVSSGLADPDPRNNDRWLEPAFSTTVPLPDRPRKTWPFFVNGAWELRPDFRGITLYRQDTGEKAELAVAGITPAEAGLSERPRPSELHRWGGDDWVLDDDLMRARAHSDAMTEFENLLNHARDVNRGKADAYAAGLLSPLEVALFKAWSEYQMALLRVIEAPGFPANKVWPAQPDAAKIEAQVQKEAEAADVSEHSAEVITPPSP